MEPNLTTLTNHINYELMSCLEKLGANPMNLSHCIQISKVSGFDLVFTIFEPAKKLQMKPAELADQIVEKLSGSKIFCKSEHKPRSYIQLKILPSLLAEYVIGEYLLPNKLPAHRDHILIEFSSPNTNKPQHLGHVRNNCLGNSMSLILTSVGHSVRKICLINDRGIHICKSMLAYEKFANGSTPESTGTKPDHFVGKYYVEFEKKFTEEYNEWLGTPEAKVEFDRWVSKQLIDTRVKNPNVNILTFFKSEYKNTYFNKFSVLGFEATEMLIKWENGDNGVRNLWQTMTAWVLQGFAQTYKSYGIDFDFWEKESDVYEFGKKVILEAESAGLLENTAGLVSCDLVKIGILKLDTTEDKNKPLIRSNGTTMYITQDVGTALKRFEQYDFDKLIYVVADEQDFHFEILFKLLAYLEPKTRDKFYHMSYGMVHLPDGRMKSREGTAVDADDLLAQLTQMANAITKKKWPDLSDLDAGFRAGKIALAAIKFYILMTGPKTTVKFDPVRSLEFNGKSGPYVLYQYARTQSIIEKADAKFLDFDLDCLKLIQTKEETELLIRIHFLDRAVEWAADHYDPSKILDAVYEIAKSFNQFYNSKGNHVIHCMDPTLKLARLLLVKTTGLAIKRAMSLCGIDVLEKM